MVTWPKPTKQQQYVFWQEIFDDATNLPSCQKAYCCCLVGFVLAMKPSRVPSECNAEVWEYVISRSLAFLPTSLQVKLFFQHQEQHDFQMKGFKDGPYQLSGMHSEPASLQPHSHWRPTWICHDLENSKAAMKQVMNIFERFLNHFHGLGPSLQLLIWKSECSWYPERCSYLWRSW